MGTSNLPRSVPNSHKQTQSPSTKYSNTEVNDSVFLFLFLFLAVGRHIAVAQSPYFKRGNVGAAYSRTGCKLMQILSSHIDYDITA